VNVKQGTAYLACSSADAAALCEPGPIATDGLGGDLTSSVSGAEPDPATVQHGSQLVLAPINSPKDQGLQEIRLDPEAWCAVHQVPCTCLF